MIIACTQCHTRFKVPDGKVTARGRKVRCSRCGHTFRIYPDSAAERGTDPAPAAARPKGPDPFVAFGPEGTSEMEKTPARGSTVSVLLARMDPAPAEEDFDVDVAGVEPASTEPAWNFPPAPSRPAAAAAAAVAWELEPPAAPAPEVLARAPLPVRALPPEAEPRSMENTELELDTIPPAGPPAPVHAQPPSSESGLAGLFEEHPPDVSQPRQEAASSPGPPGTVPLSDDLASLAGFTPAWGLAAPSRALSVDGTLSNHTPSLSPASDPESLPPAPQFGGTGTVLDDLPSLEPSDLPAHGELELDPGTGTPDWSEVSPTSLGGNENRARGRPPVGGARSPSVPGARRCARGRPFLVGSGEPGSARSLAQRRLGARATWPAASCACARGRVRTERAAGSRLFRIRVGQSVLGPLRISAPPARARVQRRGARRGTLPGLAGADHGFFEMPSGTPVPSGTPAPEPSGALLPDIPEAAEPVSAPLSLTTSGPLPTISKPPGRARLGLQESERRGTARRVSAAILNVGLAALLLLVVVGVVSSWATAGRVDGAALSPRRLLQALRPGIGVSPVEVTPGTYETRSGRWLLTSAAG